MKRLVCMLALIGTAACGGGDRAPTPTTPSPQPQPQPQPQPPTGTLSGTVTESAPTTGTRLAAARVEVFDGPHTGKFAETDGSGEFRIEGLNGDLNFRVTRSGYQSDARGAQMNQNRTVTVGLRPNPQTLSQVFTGTISGGDSTTCSDGIFTKPCKIITLPIHHDGTVSATLGWSGGSADLDLALARGSTIIASSRGVRSSETVSSNVTGGFTYELRVTYYDGANVVTYEVRVTRPN